MKQHLNVSSLLSRWAPLGLALCLAAGTALAQSPAAPAAEGNKQQNRMGQCNQEAGDKQLKGDERKAFMKGCLSHKPATQQDKMKACNADAKGMKGDERKAFMSDCLKKK